MSMSAARIRSMFRRHEEAHNRAFLFAGGTGLSGPRSPVLASPSSQAGSRELSRRGAVKQQFGLVMQRELVRAGLA